MSKKYQVFVSSTYTDLKEERMAVSQCLLDNDCIPVGMEQFPASDMSQMEYISKMLDECDYYILILAGRYGSLDSDGIGYTEKEYDYAISKGIPVMSFVVNDVDDLPIKKCESEDVKKQKLKVFREKVCSKKMVKFYGDIGELKAAVVTSINKCIRDFPAVGWTRGGSSRITLTNIGTDTLTIGATTYLYVNEASRGSFTFDYSNNNGRFTIGKDEYAFETVWSKASDLSIYAYSYGRNIDAIARIKKLLELPFSLQGDYDFSSSCRTSNIGDAIIWRNKNGKYAVTKIIAIKDDTRGADADELTCEYVIYA